MTTRSIWGKRGPRGVPQAAAGLGDHHLLVASAFGLHRVVVASGFRFCGVGRGFRSRRQRRCWRRRYCRGLRRRRVAPCRIRFAQGICARARAGRDGGGLLFGRRRGAGWCGGAGRCGGALRSRGLLRVSCGAGCQQREGGQQRCREPGAPAVGSLRRSVHWVTHMRAPLSPGVTEHHRNPHAHTIPCPRARASDIQPLAPTRLKPGRMRKGATRFSTAWSSWQPQARHHQHDLLHTDVPHRANY